MTAWLAVWPALLAAAGVLVLPGLVAAWAAGVRGIPACGLAGPLSVTLVGVAALAGPVVGVTWGPVLLLATTVVAALAALGVDLLLRRGGAPSAGADRLPARAPAVAGGMVGAGFAAAAVAGGLRRPDALPQTYDAVFHLNAVRQVLATGDASSLDVGTLSSPERAHLFYPAAWHAVTALVVELSGVGLPAGANAVSVVIAALLWTSGCLLLARQVLGSGPMPLLAAGVLAPGLAAAPYLLLAYGTVWPNALGTALLPAALAVVLSVAGLAREDALGRRRGVLMAMAVLPGLVLAHPNVVVTLLVWGLVLAPAAARRHLASHRRIAGRRLVWAGVLGYAVLVTWLVLWSPLFAATRQINWHHRETLAQAAGEWLLAAPCALPVGVVLAALVLLGLVTTARSELWWLAGCHVVTGALWVLAAGSDAPVSQLVTGPWYNDAFRLGALIPVTGLPLAVIGLRRLVRAAELVRRPALHRVGPRTLWAAALVVVVVLTQGLAVRDSARVIDVWYGGSSVELVGPGERSLLERLDTLVPPGAVVAGNPWNGSALGQALSHRRVLFPHLAGSWGKDRSLLAGYLVDAGADPAVCAAARRLHVGYVLDGPSAFWRKNRRQRLYAGTHVAGAAGFEPVASGGRLTLYRMTACGR